jgi:hypothetical protein
MTYNLARMRLRHGEDRIEIAVAWDKAEGYVVTESTSDALFSWKAYHRLSSALTAAGRIARKYEGFGYR